MISSYSEDTLVYTCHFTRDEYEMLLLLVCSGVCAWNAGGSQYDIQELRTLRDELLEGEECI